MAFLPTPCVHLNDLAEVKPGAAACQECLRIGGAWVHLRTCQACGATLCCDSSPHRHATAHYLATAHPVVASAEPGERWLWCYADERFLNY